ncbi:MAG: ribonuclease catalytic domain-containing protein [Desulfobacteraceae bacterium]
MNIGDIVEYIDQQKIITAVIIQIKKQRLRLLTENNREVNLSASRLLDISRECLDMSGTRDFLVKSLKKKAQAREALCLTIDVKELWELLYEDEEAVDLATMTVFCFDPPLTPDHESAVTRAFFKDKLYFKFGKNIFTPHTVQQIETTRKQIKAAQKRERLIKEGETWIKKMLTGSVNGSKTCDSEIINILKWYYILEKESKSAATAREMLSRAGIESPNQIFSLLVKADIWHEDQNIDLIRMDIPLDFSDSIMKKADEISEAKNFDGFKNDFLRRDLTDLPCITIDGQSTLDYDDAISLVKQEDGYVLGIHIIDVAELIKDNDLLDRDARERGTSIYMPDDKIPMLPPRLSEDMCSLKEGEIRPGISTLVRLNRFFEIIDYEVVASVIKVHKQMTYTEANMLNGEDDPITTLHKAATVLREKRLKNGAVSITLPEVNIWLDDNGEIGISRIDRENPSRMLVSEMMILANSLMAEFLSTNNVPGIFRSQPDPKKRLFSGIEHDIFLNCLQRKQLNRAMIGTKPENHAGLGVSAYATVTSPIRRYYDLINQRQIRSVLGYEKGYSKDDLDNMIMVLDLPVGNAGRMQFQRKRYWLFKHLETRKGASLEAMVLDSYRDFYSVMIKEYMLEWKIPSSGIKLEPGDHLRITIQHVDARRNQLSLFV